MHNPNPNSKFSSNLKMNSKPNAKCRLNPQHVTHLIPSLNTYLNTTHDVNPKPNLKSNFNLNPNTNNVNLTQTLAVALILYSNLNRNHNLEVG